MKIIKTAKKIFFKNTFYFWSGLAIVVCLNLYFRSFPIDFPQLKEEAKFRIEQRIYNEVIKEINQKYPSSSSFSKNILLRELISNYKKEKDKEIKQSIEEEYLRLKDRYQDKFGQTYLFELDCWHWGRYVENVLEKGIPADRIENGKFMDTFMLAPQGAELPWNNFLFYFSAILYRIFSLFKRIDLYHFLFYLPLFYCFLFSLCLFLFCYFRWGLLSAIISSLFIGLAPIFLMRSCAGWFDTDIFNLFLPLLIIWIYLKNYEYLKLKRQILWLFFTGFFVGLFCFTWINWWFIFLIIIVYEFYFLINLYFLSLKQNHQQKSHNLNLAKKHIIGLSYFLVFSIFWIVVFCGIRPLSLLFSQFLAAVKLNKALEYSIWPNVYYTVSELTSGNFFTIINNVGGIVFFLASFAALLILFIYYSLRRELLGSFDYNLVIIFMFWFMSMFFACTRGIRFSMFLLIPLGISLGWFISLLYNYFKEKKYSQIRFILLFFIFLLLSKSINTAYIISKSMFPLIDDNWYETLLVLKETTPTDSIINSWWDFGDWFKVIARRRVIFDGQSQNTPQAYWMAYVILNKDEEENIRILRMLNNGGNLAFEKINNYLKDPFKSIFLLKKVLKLEEKDAKELLLKHLPEKITLEIIELIYRKPPAKAYFIVEYTMIDKMLAISYLGNWDFLKVYFVKNIFRKDRDKIYPYLRDLGYPQEIIDNATKDSLLSYNTEEELSQRLRFYSPLLAAVPTKGGLVFFGQGIVYSLNEDIFIYSPSDTKYHRPKTLYIFEDNILKRKNIDDADFDFSALLLKEKENYKVVLLDDNLVDSLFVNLYFLNGKLLKHFKPLLEKREGERYIKVFEIIW